LPAILLLVLLAAAANVAFTTSFVSYVAKAQTPPATCLMLTSNLSQGSKGAMVTKLQDFLRSQGLLTVASTGYFGPRTAAAVSSFQKLVQLPAVGSVGPLTRFALQVSSCSPAAAPTSSMIVPESTSTTATSTTATSTATSSPTVIPTTATSTTATSTAATSTLPYHAEDFSNWQVAWGDASTTSTGALHLQGSLGNNGAEAIYPASSNWTDYRYTANIGLTNGNVSLIGRYVDANNFISCGFSKDWVEIDQVYNGSSSVLMSKSVVGILAGTDGQDKATSLSMDVKGSQVGCAGYGPGDNITYTLPAGSPMQGGIGIESWYATPLADQMDLLSVKVEPL